MTKLIIAGGRDFNSWPQFEHGVLALVNTLGIDPKELAVVSGMARGADRMGYEFARLNQLKVYEFPANWDAHGKRAGFMRNEEMGKFADVLLAFWDGESRGTAHMIDYMQNRLNKPTYAVRY